MARSRNMSFLPEDYLERRAARRTNLVCITLFVVIVGGVIGAYGMTYQRASEIRQDHEQVDADFRAAAERLEQLEELQTRKQRTIHKAEVSSALVERVPRSLLLAELINHMPMELSLLEFELETRVVRRSQRPRTSLERRREQLSRQQQEQEQRVEVPETEMNLHIEGVAPTDVEVAQFMTALSRHEMFTAPDLQYSEQTRIEDETMRRFRIAMQVDQSIDLEQMEPTRVQRGLDHDPMAEEIEFAPDSEWLAPEAEDADEGDAARSSPPEEAPAFDVPDIEPPADFETSQQE